MTAFAICQAFPNVVSPACAPEFPLALHTAAAEDLAALRQTLFALFAPTYAEPPRFEAWNFEDFCSYYAPVIETGVCITAVDRKKCLVAFLSCLPLAASGACADFSALSPPKGSWYISDITVAESWRRKHLGGAILSVLLSMLAVCRVPAVFARTRTDVPAATGLLVSHGLRTAGTISSIIQNVPSDKHLHFLELDSPATGLHRYIAKGAVGPEVSLLASRSTEAVNICAVLSGSRPSEVVCMGSY